MDVIEAMETCGAVRRFKTDPVPAELLERVVRAATRAPSPGNSQGWHFVVVRDRGLKERIGAVVAPRMQALRASLAPPAGAPVSRMVVDAVHLVESLADVPALILVCGAPVYPPQSPMERFVWSALYPATQNLLLAARALGLGTTLTTFHMVAEDELHEILGIPENVRFAALIPIGWPEQPFRPVKRKPLAGVLHWDRWSSGA